MTHRRIGKHGLLPLPTFHLGLIPPSSRKAVGLLPPRQDNVFLPQKTTHVPDTGSVAGLLSQLGAHAKATLAAALAGVALASCDSRDSCPPRNFISEVFRLFCRLITCSQLLLFHLGRLLSLHLQLQLCRLVQQQDVAQQILTPALLRPNDAKFCVF